MEFVAGLLRAAPLYALTIIFVLRARTLTREGRPTPGWRIALLTSGIAVAVAADLPPIGTQSEERLSIHTVQHLMIGDLAALLIAVAMTGPLMRPLLTLRGLRPLRWLLHPLVAVPLWVLVYYGWHIPTPLYQAALSSDLVHAVEHATMFGAGLAMWMGLLGPLPKPRSRGLDATAGPRSSAYSTSSCVAVLCVIQRAKSQANTLELGHARARRAVAGGYAERLRKKLDADSEETFRV